MIANRMIPSGAGVRLFENAVRFSVWASQRHTPLTRQSVENRFGVSRATACRWIRAYKAALGMN